MDVGTRFLEQSRACLTGEYLPKIRACCAELSREQLWWRPHEASNSIANLVLHLAGNVRQWIVAGVGGAADERRRAEEFSARGGLDADELLLRLEDAVLEADRALAALEPARLAEPVRIQGRDVTVQSAIYHVVEHFAGHTYQIVYITKMLTGSDLGFYTLVGGIPRPTWGHEPAQVESKPADS